MLDLISQFLFYGSLYGFILVLLGLGFNIILSTSRSINMAHGELITVGAYMSYVIVNTLTSTYYVISILATVGLMFVMALISYKLMLKTFIERHEETVEVLSVIAFLGMSLIIQQVVALIFSSTSVSFVFLPDKVFFLGLSVALNRIVIFVSALALTMGVLILLTKTRIGIVLRAVIQDYEASALIGLNTDKVIFSGILLGFVLAGIAGNLISMIYALDPYMGSTYKTLSFLVTIVGGIGNILGTVSVGLMFGYMDILFSYYIGAWIKDILIFSLVIATLLFRPYGLLGKHVRKV